MQAQNRVCGYPHFPAHYGGLGASGSCLKRYSVSGLRLRFPYSRHLPLHEPKPVFFVIQLHSLPLYSTDIAYARPARL